MTSVLKKKKKVTAIHIFDLGNDAQLQKDKETQFYFKYAQKSHETQKVLKFKSAFTSQGQTDFILFKPIWWFDTCERVENEHFFIFFFKY